MGHGDTTLLEKLGHGTVGYMTINKLIIISSYIFIYL